MKSALQRFGFLLTMALSACAPGSYDEEEQEEAAEEGRSGIVGGTQTTIEQRPWQISLQSSGGGHFCGGTIMCASWIVTANHCLEGESASSLRVVAAATNRNGSGGQIRNVSQIVPIGKGQHFRQIEPFDLRQFVRRPLFMFRLRP